MSDAKRAYVRRTSDERISEIDLKIAQIASSIEDLEQKKKAVITSFNQKIAAAKKRIQTLEEKKYKILNPNTSHKSHKTKKQKLEAIMKEAQKAGMSPEDIALRLGIDLVG